MERQKPREDWGIGGAGRRQHGDAMFVGERTDFSFNDE